MKLLNVQLSPGARPTGRWAHFLFTLVALGMAVAPGRACLSPTVNERAVQWSTAVVQAKLISIGERVPMEVVEPAPEPAARVENGKPQLAKMRGITRTYWYRLYDFDITNSLDGALARGSRVQVIRFFGRVDNPMMRCSTMLTHDNVGKTFTLLLRPEADLALQQIGDSTKADMRPAALHALRTYTVIHVRATDSSADGDADLSALIRRVRASEKKVTLSRATAKAQLLASVQDSSKIAGASDQLLAMGPKAIPALLQVLKNLPVRGPAPAKWQSIFADEAWYHDAAGPEQAFSGVLEAIPQRAEATTLMRTSLYRLGARTVFTGGQANAVLDTLVGQPVSIQGKAVEMDLEGQRLSELWPARVQPQNPIAVRLQHVVELLSPPPIPILVDGPHPVVRVGDGAFDE